MFKLCHCACCKGQLEPAQQLRFLVETDNLDNPSFLARIRMLPSVNGKPLPVCTACQTRIEAEPVAKRQAAKPTRTKAPLVVAVGLLGVFSVGMLLGSLLNARA